MGENTHKPYYLIKGLVGRIFRELLQLSNIKTNNPMKDWPKSLNGHFSLEDIQMANERTQKRSSSLVTREIQIKTKKRKNQGTVRGFSAWNRQGWDMGQQKESEETGRNQGTKSPKTRLGS